jgi:hypothetical protein
MTESFPAYRQISTPRDRLALIATVCRHKLFDEDRRGSSMTALRTLSSYPRGDLSQFHGDTPFLAISHEISPQILFMV